MLKLNSKKTILLAFAGSVFSLAALLIFMLLPSSELANGIQYSGKDALWVLVLAPVFSLCGAVNFLYAFLKDFKAWSNFLSKPIFIGAAAVFCGLMIFNFAVYLSYLITQFKLGFVAPYTGTVYDSLEILLIIVSVLQFAVSAAATAIIVKNK